MGGFVINRALKDESALVIIVEPLPDSGLEYNSKKSAAIWSPGSAPDPILKNISEGAASQGMRVEAHKNLCLTRGQSSGSVRKLRT